MVHKDLHLGGREIAKKVFLNNSRIFASSKFMITTIIIEIIQEFDHNINKLLV